MAASFDSLRLRHQRSMDARLTAAHRGMARAIAALVVQAATGRDATGKPIIPASRKVLDDLKTAVWERVVKPFYVGSGTDALKGADPQSPYALLLVQGIEGATRIQAERQVAIVKRLCKDPAVLAWLTGPRPMLPMREMQPVVAGRITELTLTPTAATRGSLRGADGRIDTDAARAALVRPRGTYEPFHLFVDPNGYRLSDRIWRTSIDVRARVDAMLEYEVARGTSAVDIATMVEPFLTPAAATAKTQKPYGTSGSYSARRLARTEITAAAGRATVNAAAANPFVERLQWRLSASHPKMDHCDDNARGGPNGDGIYAIADLPRYPDHPHCLCSILPVPTGSTADLVESLRADIQAARSNLIGAVGAGDPARGRRLQGLLSPEHLTRSLLDGTLDTSVSAAVRQSAQRLPANVRARAARTVAPKVVSFVPASTRLTMQTAPEKLMRHYGYSNPTEPQQGKVIAAIDALHPNIQNMWDRGELILGVSPEPIMAYHQSMWIVLGEDVIGIPETVQHEFIHHILGQQRFRDNLGQFRPSTTLFRHAAEGGNFLDEELTMTLTQYDPRRDVWNRKVQTRSYDVLANGQAITPDVATQKVQDAITFLESLGVQL